MLSPATLDFLDELAANKPRYEALVRAHCATRFARDKRRHKTNIGIRFRHELGKDVHAPGFYPHIATDGCFLGVAC